MVVVWAGWGAYCPPTEVLRPHCCGLYGTEADGAFRIAIGEETMGEAAYVEGDGA